MTVKPINKEILLSQQQNISREEGNKIMIKGGKLMSKSSAFRTTFSLNMPFRKNTVPSPYNLNESLTTGSSHSISTSTSTSTTTKSSSSSSSSSFHDESMSEQENEDTICVLQSCMKGTRRVKRNCKTLRIRFKRSLEQVQLIEPYFQYAEDLWFTKTDNIGIETADDKTVQSESYMVSYYQARKQIFHKIQKTNTTTTTMEGQTADRTQGGKRRLMSSKLYDEIVEGRCCGYAGLEHYSLRLMVIRRHNVRETVLSVIAKYNEGQYSLDQPTADEVSRKVRSCSKSLTQADRYWALVIGQADVDALVCD